MSRSRNPWPRACPAGTSATVADAAIASSRPLAPRHARRARQHLWSSLARGSAVRARGAHTRAGRRRKAPVAQSGRIGFVDGWNAARPLESARARDWGSHPHRLRAEARNGGATARCTERARPNACTGRTASRHSLDRTHRRPRHWTRCWRQRSRRRFHRLGRRRAVKLAFPAEKRQHPNGE